MRPTSALLTHSPTNVFAHPHLPSPHHSDCWAMRLRTATRRRRRLTLRMPRCAQLPSLLLRPMQREAPTASTARRRWPHPSRRQWLPLPLPLRTYRRMARAHCHRMPHPAAEVLRPTLLAATGKVAQGLLTAAFAETAATGMVAARLMPCNSSSSSMAGARLSLMVMRRLAQVLALARMTAHPHLQRLVQVLRPLQQRQRRPRHGASTSSRPGSQFPSIQRPWQNRRGSGRRSDRATPKTGAEAEHPFRVPSQL